MKKRTAKQKPAKTGTKKATRPAGARAAAATVKSAKQARTSAKPKPSRPTAKALAKAVAAKAVAKAARKAPARSIAAKVPSGKKLTDTARTQPVELPPDYRPSEDEPFMNGMQRAYFRQKLLAWKEDIIRQTRETLAGLHEDSSQHADIADRATSETDRALELRARDRQRKLIAKIDAALARIEDGTYGYCEETGEPIGLRRLDARPIATLSLEAQERHERRERVYREE
jgi:DnaK suppressor protein